MAPAVTEPVPACDLQCQIDALAAKLDALAARVNAIQLANVAAWDALLDALDAGLPPYMAALAARGAGLNAIYGLD